jgi:hypothetical protein
MKAEILFHTSSTPKVFEDVYAIYTKDVLLCVHLMTGLIVKYPLMNVFSVSHMHGEHMGTTFKPEGLVTNWPTTVPYVPKMKDNSPPRFEPALLDSMHDPLSVRVEKIKGSNATHVELITKEGFTPSFGWLKNEIKDIETWVFNECGGGLYHFVVVDSSGGKMEWYTTYDTKLYPERVHPSLRK